MDLTLSIVNTNNGGLLKNFLSSIDVESIGIECEIIVVDNASTDGSAEMLARDFKHVKVITNDTINGYGFSHNRAIKQSNGKYILILNEDMLNIDNAIRRMYDAAIKADRLGVMGCKLINEDGSLQHSCFNFPTVVSELFEAVFPYSVVFSRSTMRSKMFYSQHDSTKEVDIVMGCCMLIPKAVLEEVGPFDEQFYVYSEEHDLCRRIKNNGYSILFYNGAEMIHYGGETSKNMSLRMYRTLIESKLKYFRKHHGCLSMLAIRIINLYGSATRWAVWSVFYLFKTAKRDEIELYLKRHACSIKVSLKSLIN